MNVRCIVILLFAVEVCGKTGSFFPRLHFWFPAQFGVHMFAQTGLLAINLSFTASLHATADYNSHHGFIVSLKTDEASFDCNNLHRDCSFSVLSVKAHGLIEIFLWAQGKHPFRFVSTDGPPRTGCWRKLLCYAQRQFPILQFRTFPWDVGHFRGTSAARRRQSRRTRRGNTLPVAFRRRTSAQVCCGM